MNKTASIIAIIIIVIVVSWVLITNSSVIQTQVKVPATSDTAKPHEVPLNTENNSNELGVATLTEGDGNMMIVVDLKGQPAGDAQPASINQGSCSSLGATQYPLPAINNGSSSTSLDLSLDILRQKLPLAVAIYKSTTDMSIVSCGDITL